MNIECRTLNAEHRITERGIRSAFDVRCSAFDVSRFCKSVTTETINQAMMPGMKTESPFGLRREAKHHAALEKGNRLRKAVSPLRSATALQNIASLLLCVFALIPLGLRAATNDLTTALQKGLFEEEANHNLDAAISNYQALATQFDRDRQIAATAIFRLGECYHKLGQTNEAVFQYQRIVREFSDQQTLATLSQQNLTGLGVASQPRFQERLVAIIKKNPQDSIAPATPESAARVAVMEAEAASLKAQIEHLSSLKQEGRRVAVQQNYSNPVLTKLMQDLAEAELTLASLTNDYAPADLHVTRVTALMNALNGQIDAQMNGVIEGLQTKMEADLNAAKILRDQSGPASAVLTEASPATDDEAREIRRIQQLIQNSPDLINAERGDDAPLFGAAGRGQLRVAGFLLDHGANVEGVNQHVPLLAAARNGNRAMVELLLSRGADVNAKESDGYTALHYAANRGFQTVTEVLLANKAEVNVPDKNMGNTPLLLAAKGGQVKIIQILRTAGANPNAENKQGRTPLSLAAESGSPEAVKILLAAKADPNSGKLDAPLLCAIHKQDVVSAELLLKNGANQNLKGGMDWQATIAGNIYSGAIPSDRAACTPLYLAVSTDQLPMVNLLLKFKADPNDSQTDDRPLLFSALSNPDILGALLDAGGKVDSHLTEGMTLLDYALNMNFATAAVEVLLQHGADPNVRESHGNTPLHYAVWGSMDRNKMGLLLDHQANPNVRNDDGKTSLDYIKASLAQSPAPNTEASLNEIAGLLRSHGALDNLPHWDRIEVSRPAANYSATVFRKGTNDWNRFTLLETLLNFYPEQFLGPSFGARAYSPTSLPLPALPLPDFGARAYSPTSLPLPDLARLTILRHQPNTTNETRIQVNLLNATNGIDGSRDVPLEFGDVVEVPEREHALGDRPIGLTDSQHDDMVNCLKGSVRLVVHGGKVELPVYPYPDGSLIGSVLKRPEAQGILLSSSDLSRVKVTRHDPVTGKRCEWVVNCAPWLEAVPAGAGSTFAQRLRAVTERGRNNGQLGAAPDLWLRDGDVIEVPEKP
jgi:cytohesin